MPLASGLGKLLGGKILKGLCWIFFSFVLDTLWPKLKALLKATIWTPITFFTAMSVVFMYFSNWIGSVFRYFFWMVVKIFKMYALPDSFEDKTGGTLEPIWDILGEMVDFFICKTSSTRWIII
jgi:hypothetical protein